VVAEGVTKRKGKVPHRPEKAGVGGSIPSLGIFLQESSTCAGHHIKNCFGCCGLRSVGQIQFNGIWFTRENQRTAGCGAPRFRSESRERFIYRQLRDRSDVHHLDFDPSERGTRRSAAAGSKSSGSSPSHKAGCDFSSLHG